MTYLSQQQLLQEIHRKPLQQVVEQRILGGMPWVFKDKEADHELLLSHLTTKLSIPKECIKIVGSGKVGYSISPDTYGRIFSDYSDVDVVVVDTTKFEAIWTLLLDWRYPWHLRKWPELERQWGLARLENLICGWCIPDEIRAPGLSPTSLPPPLRAIAQHWFDSFKSLGQHPTLASRAFNARLYLSWEFVQRYHVWSLKVVQQKFPLKRN
jgi:hypothetical protein